MRNLSNFPVGIKEYEILIEEIPISVCLKRVFNSDKLLVFFHGLGCSNEIFDHSLTHTALESYSLLLIDFPGFGQSGKPIDFSYSMDNQAKICEKLLDLFPQVRLHIIAHSMGGAVPLLFSDKIFKRIDSFANLEGNLTDADCTIFSRSIADVSYDEYAMSLFAKQKRDLAKFTELKFDETTPLAMYKSAISLVKWSDGGELLKKFKSLNCKKAYFYGEKNKDLGTIKHLEGIPKIMILKSGHSMMLDNPDMFYNELHKFISE